MKVVKAINWQGSKAVLFANGDIAWAGMIFPNGMGANLALIDALSKEELTPGQIEYIKARRALGYAA